MLTFEGGIHPDYKKLTSRSPIEIAKIPKKVIMPLVQHIGAPCNPLVKPGDKVRIGQKIADSEKFVSAPIHAPISGAVKEISSKPHPVLGSCNSIVIQSEGPLEWVDTVRKRDNISAISPEQLRNIIREAGIVGLGGAAFPTHVKLSPPPEKKIDTIILNGAECEPYLTCDHRLMLEKTEQVIKGFLIMKRILNAKTAIIGVEDNKENAAAFFKNKVPEDIQISTLPTKYPQGAEKMLIYALTDRKVPAGGLPMDVGCLVTNVQTAKAVHDAVWEGKPLIERVVTVTGAVKAPKNLLVKIGTPYHELVEQCGGYRASPGKIVSGGPMMGIAQSTDLVPVVKGTSGILVQLQPRSTEEAKDCIRCGRCIDVCPMALMPTQIARYAEKDDIGKAKEYFAMDCFECGCCSYVCPSKIPLVHWIKYAKNEIKNAG